MELVVQMVTKHQWFIGLTLGFELLWWFPVEKKEKTYEKNMEYPSPWDHTYFIVLTFWHLVVPCSAFTAWCKIGRVSVLFVLIQFQFSHCFFLRSLSVCAGKCQTQSQCPRWWIAMLCELHRRAPLCAVFHVISQETDLPPLETEFFTLATDPDQRYRQSFINHSNNKCWCFYVYEKDQDLQVKFIFRKNRQI